MCNGIDGKRCESAALISVEKFSIREPRSIECGQALSVGITSFGCSSSVLRSNSNKCAVRRNSRCNSQQWKKGKITVACSRRTYCRKTTCLEMFSPATQPPYKPHLAVQSTTASTEDSLWHCSLFTTEGKEGIYLISFLYHHAL